MSNSSVVAAPTEVKIVLLNNEYEPGRGHLAIYNWAGVDSVNVDLSSVLPNGTSFEVREIKKVFKKKPVVSGTYAGPVNIPLGGSEFSVFLVMTKY